MPTFAHKSHLQQRLLSAGTCLLPPGGGWGWR